MSAERMMQTPCTLLLRQAAGEDALGSPVLGEPAEVETTCAFQQRDREEPGGEGETSVTEWNLFLAWETTTLVQEAVSRPLNTGDAARVKGRTYEVVGDPEELDEGSRALWHVAATVKRISGSGDEASS